MPRWTMPGSARGTPTAMPGREPGPRPDGAWVLAIDGGARGNPGPAGAGAVLYDAAGRRIAGRAFPLGRMTNNAAEYEGLLNGLALAQEHGASRLLVQSDSELLVFQMSGAYKIKAPHLRELADRARAMAAAFTSITYVPIPRERNVEADRLANQAMDEVEGSVHQTGRNG